MIYIFLNSNFKDVSIFKKIQWNLNDRITIRIRLGIPLNVYIFIFPVNMGIRWSEGANIWE